MSDIPDEDEDALPKPAPRKTSGLAWALVFLFFVVLVVDLASTMGLGRNAPRTFEHVESVIRESTPPTRR